MRTSLLRAWILLSVVGSASAQSFNLDIGMNLILWPTPSNAYGAAANQAGFWNAVVPPYSQGLADLAGAGTVVGVSSTGGLGAYNDPFTGLTGDDEAYMADQAVVPNLGVVGTIDFAGLEDGTYEVYTYAWESGGSDTLVDVPLGTGGQQTIGGTWNGSPHVLGVTHALHEVIVVGGTLSIEIQGAAFDQSGGVNGVQLVKTGGNGTTNYCMASANSTGAPALISSSGSLSVATNAFTLMAGPVPSQPGLFYYGDLQLQLAFGNGFRCVGGLTARLSPMMPTAGQLVGAVDFQNPPSAATQITAGSTWNFQAWFRDPAAGGAAFDLSDGLSATFLP